MRLRGGSSRKLGELLGDTGFVKVVANAESKPRDEAGVAHAAGGDLAFVFLGKRAFEAAQDAFANRPRVLNDEVAFGQFASDESAIGFEDGERLRRRVLFEISENALDTLGGHEAVDEA